MTRGKMKRVAVIHPWFPQYREAFFSELKRLCDAEGIEVRVFYGDPPPEWRERGDAVSRPGITRLRTRFFRLGSRSLVLKSLVEFNRQGAFDLVILEQAIRNLETYRLMFSKRYARRIAWWGHGKTYTQAKPDHEERLKFALTRRGLWFFAYTEGGAEEVARAGFDKERITVVNNSTDTATLRRDLASVDEHELRQFEEQHRLRGKTALYIGGLDSSKRIPFLLAAAARCWETDSDFRLLIVGNGELRRDVEEFASDHPWCRYLGPLFGAERAVPMRSANLLAVPGRVGLVAVDSFVAELPIVTTAWPFHAPEFEYLRPGVNSVVTADSIDAYAGELMRTLSETGFLESLKEGCAQSADEYSVELMAARFSAGIVQALNARSR